MGTLSYSTTDQHILLDQVCSILEHNLGLEAGDLKRESATLILGEIPELDSMAIVTVLNSLESHFGIIIEDDEVNTEMLATLGNLVDFIVQKISIDKA